MDIRKAVGIAVLFSAVCASSRLDAAVPCGEKISVEENAVSFSEKKADSQNDSANRYVVTISSPVSFEVVIPTDTIAADECEHYVETAIRLKVPESVENKIRSAAESQQKAPALVLPGMSGYQNKEAQAEPSVKEDPAGSFEETIRVEAAGLTLVPWFTMEKESSEVFANVDFSKLEDIKPQPEQKKEAVKDTEEKKPSAERETHHADTAAKKAVMTPQQKDGQEQKPLPEPPSKQHRTYTVVHGDTLPELAAKYYGSKEQWVKIYEANSDKIEKGALQQGQVLVIP